MPLGTKVGLGSGHIVLLGDPASPHKGHSAPPNFRPMSIVAKRSPISATAEHLYKFLSLLHSRLIFCLIRQYDRYIIFSVSAVYVGSCSVILVCELNDVIFLTAHCCISDIILIYVRVRTRCFQFSCFTHKCWPDCKPEGPLFSPTFVCLCVFVCLSVCLCASDRHFYPASCNVDRF